MLPEIGSPDQEGVEGEGEAPYEEVGDLQAELAVTPDTFYEAVRAYARKIEESDPSVSFTIEYESNLPDTRSYRVGVRKIIGGSTYCKDEKIPVRVVEDTYRADLPRAIVDNLILAVVCEWLHEAKSESYKVNQGATFIDSVRMATRRYLKTAPHADAVRLMLGEVIDLLKTCNVPRACGDDPSV